MQTLDWEGDGRLDILIANSHGAKENTWVQGMEEALMPAEQSPFDFVGDAYGRGDWNRTSLQVVDWDGDSDLDVLVCIRGYTAEMEAFFSVDFWENDGDGFQLERSFSGPDWGLDWDASNFNFMMGCRAQLADWDNDGDFDLVVNIDALGTGKVYFLEAVGDFDFVAHEESQSPLRLVSEDLGPARYGRLQVVDWDGDGDVDVILMTRFVGTYFYEQKNGRLERLANDLNPLGWVNPPPLDVFHFSDMDGDGDLDAVELTRDSLKFWRQVGVQDFIEREVHQNPFRYVKDQDIVETFTVADWDQDGRMDLLFLDMLVDPTDLMRETLSVELWQSGASLYAKTVLFRESESTHFNFTSASRKAAMQLVHWDGRPERSILFTGLADGHQRLLEDEGGGNFTMRFLSQAPLGACVAVDADHDGDSDLYCVDSANVSFHRSIGGEGAFEKVAEVQSPQPGAVCTLQTLSGDPRHQVSLALVCEEDGSFTAYTASGAAEAAIHDLQPMVGWANSPYWPYFVDWDGDGALDAVAERKNIARDGMRLFSLGHCVSPCNGGRCEADGRCSCLPDRALEDCSGCRTEHAMAIDGSCLPCPGFGTLQGTCSRRGRCEDDAFAMSQARGNSSNSSLLLERGSASCDCNPYFSGQDCSLGECPPGMELQEDLGACADCAPGMYKPQAGNWACLRCQAGRFADGPGSELCTPCTSGLVRYTSAAGEDQCEPDTSSVFIAALGMLSCLAGCLLVPILLGTEIPVQDISFKRGQGVLVTTKGPHLIRPSKDGPAVFCEGTGVPVLDRPEARGKLKGIVLDARSLQLCMEDGETLQEAANSSCGWLRMPLRDALLFSSLGSCPILAVVLVQLALFMAAAVYSQLHPGLAALTVLVGLLLSGIFRQFRGPWAARYSLLRKAHRKYLSRLQRRQSRPERTPRGSRRAITLGQLCELQEAFQSFLYDRNMYYICHNIVRPLTEKDKVSFAELSGPHDAQYFVSHYWGTSFQDYIRSIWKQAESSTRGGEKPGFLMQQTAYWICTFAINQWEVLEEVGSGHGNGWQNSSFYLALRSPIKATLMILDEDVIPLTRSWCLFELFQSFQLSAQDPNFQIFFCTQSGVLNHGNCSVDAAMAISDKLVTLRLENASASEEKDKKMIDELIQKEEGGFEAVNAALKMRISEILQATEQHLSVELARLATGLKASLESEETAIEF